MVIQDESCHTSLSKQCLVIAVATATGNFWHVNTNFYWQTDPWKTNIGDSKPVLIDWARYLGMISNECIDINMEKHTSWTLLTQAPIVNSCALEASRWMCTHRKGGDALCFFVGERPARVHLRVQLCYLLVIILYFETNTGWGSFACLLAIS